jgi:RNA polymerase sigma factor (sigma-70 family)
MRRRKVKRADRLFSTHIDLAERMAKTYCKKRAIPRKSLIYDDVYSAALYGLYMAARGSDTTGAGRFRKYAGTKIFCAISDWSRIICREKRGCRMRGKPVRIVSMGLDELKIEAKTPWEEVASRDSEEAEYIRSKLPAEMRWLFDELARGRLQREIAKSMGVHESRVSQLASELRTVLEEVRK